MSIQTACTGCGLTLRLKEALAGKRVRCPRCAAAFQVPSLEEPAPPAEQPEPGFSLAPAEDSPPPPEPEEPEPEEPRERRPRRKRRPSRRRLWRGKTLLWLSVAAGGAVVLLLLILLIRGLTGPSTSAVVLNPGDRIPVTNGHIKPPGNVSLCVIHTTSMDARNSDGLIDQMKVHWSNGESSRCVFMAVKYNSGSSSGDGLFAFPGPRDATPERFEMRGETVKFKLISLKSFTKLARDF